MRGEIVSSEAASSWPTVMVAGAPRLEIGGGASGRFQEPHYDIFPHSVVKKYSRIPAIGPPPRRLKKGADVRTAQENPLHRGRPRDGRPDRRGIGGSGIRGASRL